MSDLSPDILAKKLRALWNKYETTPDGVPDGLGDTGEELFEYFMDNLEDICYYLETWDSE